MSSEHAKNIYEIPDKSRLIVFITLQTGLVLNSVACIVRRVCTLVTGSPPGVIPKPARIQPIPVACGCS